MNGIIYLLGGGELRDGDTHLIDEDIMSQAPKDSTFVFFGFAAQDSTDYADTIRSVYGGNFTVIVPTVAKGRDYAINAIKSAAVIYFGGGDTEQLLRVFSQWELVDHLCAAIDRGVHVVGMSAGAQALCTWYVHEGTDIFELRKGWGIVPGGVLVHAIPSSFDKAKQLWSDNGLINKHFFVAIGEGVAWRVCNQADSKIGLGYIRTLSVEN